MPGDEQETVTRQDLTEFRTFLLEQLKSHTSELSSKFEKASTDAESALSVSEQLKVESELKFSYPGVRFSKDPKTSRARKPPRKAPETTFGCFSKHPKTFDSEKYVIFPRKLHGYSLPPEKRFRVCF